MDEMTTACSLALSSSVSDVLRIVIMNTTSIRSIVVSFGSLRLNRITPSSERHAPATIVRPRTRSAFASNDPRIDVCATTISPARRAKMTMNNSGRFPSVDWSTPVVAGPKRAPTHSVPTPTVQARSAGATMPTQNWSTAPASAWWSTPRITAAANEHPMPIRVFTSNCALRPKRRLRARCRPCRRRADG